MRVRLKPREYDAYPLTLRSTDGDERRVWIVHDETCETMVEEREFLDAYEEVGE